MFASTSPNCEPPASQPTRATVRVSLHHFRRFFRLHIIASHELFACNFKRSQMFGFIPLIILPMPRYTVSRGL